MKRKSKLQFRRAVNTIPADKPILFWDTCALLDMLRIPYRDKYDINLLISYERISDMIKRGDIVSLTSSIVDIEFDNHYGGTLNELRRSVGKVKRQAKEYTDYMSDDHLKSSIKTEIDRIEIEQLCHYKGRYMIDYRDLSIEQKFGFKQLFSLMLKYSCANVISSPGFKKCLPKGNFYLSHNFDENAVRKVLDSKAEEGGFNIEGGVDVLTIGAIRDYSSNIEVVKALANQEGFSARFIGKGEESAMLEDYCKQNNVKNVFFKGFYQKPEEAGYVRSCTFMNIFYPRIVTHDTALSNRFYNSLIYRKPMIVTKNTCQGDYAEKYHVGVAIDECCNLTEKLRWFLQQDYLEYRNQCDILLKSFMEDQELFVNAVIEFISYDS